MAEELTTYNQIETGDPDPLGLEKKLKQARAIKPATSDPLGLEAKLRAIKEPAQQPKQDQPAFQIQLSQPTLRDIPATTVTQPSTPNKEINIPKEQVAYVPDEKTYEIQKQAGKARVAHEKVNTALVGNDVQYEKKLRESRRDNYTIESLRSEYKQKGQILAPQDEQRLLQKEKDRQFNLPVTPEDITDFKTGTILNPNLSRKFVKDLNDKEVSESAYQVDKFNEIANDPDPNAHKRIEKINQISKGIKTGKYIYDPESRTVVEPLGLVGSLIEGTTNKFKADEEHDFLKNTKNDAAIIMELEDERNNPKLDDPIKVPRGKVSEAIKSVAEMPLAPIVAGVAGTIGGTFIGNPELGTVAATALGAYENRKAQYRATFKQVYNELRDQGKPEFDALSEARKQAENAQEIGTIVGGAQGLIGAKIGAIPIKGTNFNVGFQQAVGDFLKKNGSEFGKIALDAVAQGGLAASGEVAKNKLAQAAGIKRDLDSGTADTFWGNVLMAGGIGAALKLGRGMSSVNYKRILSGLTKNVPEETINVALQEKVSSGDITQQAADQALNEINKYKEKDAQIPPNVTEDARFKIQDNIDKLNELEQQKEATHKSLQEPIKEKIQKLTDQNLELSKETEKPIKSETGLPKAKEKEAIDFAHELVDEGVLPDTHWEAAKKDPIKFWQTIAQQAQNRDENWKPLSQPIEEQSVRDNYGDTVVDYAKELFPAPEVKESSISVIKPGEIKQPETITISPREQPKEIKSTKGVSVIMPGEIEKIGHVEITEHGEDTKTANKEENGVQPSKLSEEGIKEAKELGKSLVDNNKNKIVTSEVERAKQTAEEAVKEAKNISGKDIPVESNKVLNTWDIGEYDGKPEGSFVEGTWVNKPNETPVGGESFNDFKTRMEQAHEYVKSLSEDTHVIGHSKVMRALGALEKTGGKWTDETTNIFLNNKELTHAIQEPSTGGVFQHTQEGIGAEGGERGGMEPGKQGEEITRTRTQEEGKTTGEEGVAPPSVVPGAKNVFAEQPATQLSFRGLQEVANEFGYEDVKSRERVTDIQERKNAEVTANEWAEKGEYQQNVDDLLDRIERREHVPTAKQRLILEQYLANERQKAREMPKNSLEYDRQLQKLQRIKDIGQIARQEAGAALRLPNEGTLPHPITDESSAMIAKMEANSVDKLTDQQKAEIEVQVEKYRKANDEANAKITELEEQVAKLDAQKEFNKAKSTTKRTKKSSEERATFRRTEIEAAREALRKLRSGESGLSAVPLPGVRELMAIAPHVKNIMVDLVSQGVDNLQDVISHLHTEFKDVLEGLTEKNIHDIIAGEYNEPSRPLSELQRQVRDLQEEAKLINQLEALENGVEPKAEKAKRERNQKIKALRDKINEFRKEEGSKELADIKKRNEEQARKIREKIAAGKFEKEAKKSIFDREDVKTRLPQLRKQALDAIAKKEEAQHEFDLALFNDEMSKRSKLAKVAGFASKLVHTSKALLSGIDDSATFVQNGLLMLANPKVGAKAWWAHAKDAVSPARFKRELAAIHADPDWEVISKSGLEVVEPHSAASKQVEEAFEKNLLAQIEIKGVKPWEYTGGIFERAFTSMGNNLRVLLFKERMQMLREQGKTFESHPQEFKDAARAINELSGRGKLPGGLAQAAPYITPFMWAPRLLTSTINTLGLSDITYTLMGRGEKGYYRSLTPMQRKYALGQLGRGIFVGASIMGLAALGGAKVDYDPRSVTFGDIIAGDHHYNVFGRFTPVIKTIVQAIGGTRIKGSGEKQDLDTDKWGAKTRLSVVGGFFRGKTTPALGAALNLAEHRNYFTGEKFTVKDLPAALLQPMSIKELRDGWKNDGTWTILNRFLPAFEGLKVSDERDFNKNSGSTTSTTITSSREKPTRTKPTRVNPHKR